LLIGLLLAFAGAEGNLVADEPVNTKPFVRFTPRNFTIDFNELPKETVSVDRKFTVQVGGRPIPKSFVVDLYKGVGEMPKAPRRIFYRLAKGARAPLGFKDVEIPVPADGKVELIFTVMRDRKEAHEYLFQFYTETVNGTDIDSVPIKVPMLLGSEEDK